MRLPSRSNSRRGTALDRVYSIGPERVEASGWGGEENAKMGVCRNRGYPKWLVYFMENPHENEWFGGTPWYRQWYYMMIDVDWYWSMMIHGDLCWFMEIYDDFDQLHGDSWRILVMSPSPGSFFPVIWGYLFLLKPKIRYVIFAMKFATDWSSQYQ